MVDATGIEPVTPSV